MAERGFTLVEVLIALTLFAVIMTLALGGLRFSATAWQAGTHAVDVSENIHAARRVLSDWVGAAVIRRQSQDLSAPLQLGFAGAEDRLVFAAHRPPYPSRGGLYRMEMEVSLGQPNNLTLLRARVAPADATMPEDWEALAELPGAWGFAFVDASDPGEWRSDWTDSETLPDLVRLAPLNSNSGWPSFYSSPVGGISFVCVNRTLDPNRSVPADCRL